MPQHPPFDHGRRGLLAAGGAWLFLAALRPQGARAQSAAAMRIGIIGAGRIGGTLGGLWVKAGHPVMLSSRHPEELKDLVASLGPLASAGTVAQAIAFGDALLIAVPYGALPQIGQDYGGALKGKVLLDACNAVASRDGSVADEVEQEGIGVVSQKYLSGARLVRAFNTMSYTIFAREANRPAPGWRSRSPATIPRRPGRGAAGRRCRLRPGGGRQAGRCPALPARRSGLRAGGERGGTQAEAVAGAMTAWRRWLRRAVPATPQELAAALVVLRLFLRAPGGLLRAAAPARPDGHRRRDAGAAVAVHRDLRDAAGRAAGLRRAGGAAAAGPVHPGRLPLLRRSISRCSGCCWRSASRR